MKKSEIINLLFGVIVVSLVFVYLGLDFKSEHAGSLRVEWGFPYPLIEIDGSATDCQSFFCFGNFILDFLLFVGVVSICNLMLLGIVVGTIWLIKKLKIGAIHINKIKLSDFIFVIFVITVVTLIYMFTHFRRSYESKELGIYYVYSHKDFVLDFLSYAGVLGIFYLMFIGMCEGVIRLVKKLKK